MDKGSYLGTELQLEVRSSGTRLHSRVTVDSYKARHISKS
jgi:hypothetical protein